MYFGEAVFPEKSTLLKLFHQKNIYPRTIQKQFSKYGSQKSKEKEEFF